MSTVATIVDQVFRNMLEPPDYQAAAFTGTSANPGGFLIGETDFTASPFEIPEDENLVRLGSLLEWDKELVRVTAWDVATRTITVVRGVEGTIEVDHPATARVKLSPPFSRQSVFEAVRNNIISLYPKLWTVRTEAWSAVGASVYPVLDPLAVEIVEINPEGSNWVAEIGGRIVDYHQLAGGRALIVAIPNTPTLWVRYRRRFATATAEADTYDQLGFETVWEPVVVAGAAADMMAGRDLPAAHTAWVQSTLEAENIKVGTRTSLSVGLARYRELLIDRFAREMEAEDSNKINVEMVDPFMQVVR